MAKKKKQIIIRVRKIAPKRYLIEQRRKFLWLWQFFQKGCPTLGLKKFYSSVLTAKTAIKAHAERKNMQAVIIIN
jgi:hypothetical protein